MAATGASLLSAGAETPDGNNAECCGEADEG